MDEKVFHETLKKIRWSTNRDELAAATRTTLQLLLRRPGDQKLLNSLLAQTDAIIGRLAPGKGAQTAEIRQAAVRCVVLLQSAKRGRLSRAEQEDRDERKRHRRVLILSAATAAVAAFYLFLLPQRNIESPGQTVAAAIENALHTARLGFTRRGDVTVRATHLHTIVTAERLTPEDCVTAAKEVQKMGDLTINDTSVGRPNDNKLTKLCHQLGDATLTVTVNQYRKR